jgi:PAS domain S-box-containing protein
MSRVEISADHEQLDEVIEGGLSLACFLGRADRVILNWKNQEWVVDAERPARLRPEQLRGGLYFFESDLGGGNRLRFESDDVELQSADENLKACIKMLSRALMGDPDSERYRNFLKESSEGVWRVELREPLPSGLTPDEQVHFFFEHGFLAECNPAMARMYGYERPEEIIGVPLTALMIEEDPRNHIYLESFVRNRYRMRDAESVEKDRDGKIRYFVNNLIGIQGANGICGAWGTQTDVTAFKALEARLTETADAAAEANKAKSAFLASISHEIRTPLNVILGFADLALDKADLSADTKGYISSIRRNAEQLSEFLGEILDLSKIEASRLEIEEIHFPLVPMISEVISFLDLHAREKNLDLSLEKIGPLPKLVKTDPTRLRQILTNIISNAVKFTERGFVKVGVRMTSAPKPGIPLQVEFTVTDSGIGISEERREKLFTPYTQAERSTTRQFGGTGLGLHLSKQLAQALGGDLILASSQLGQGSTFTFTVSGGTFDGELIGEGKSGSGKPVTSPSAHSENHEVFEGKKILLIEDSEDNQTLIKHYLTAVGLQVDVANNGFDGLEKVDKDHYDLIVLDIQMPGMDGHQVARSLREQGFSRPIVALTAHAFKEDREKAFQNGFNEYLTKPINRVALLKTLGQRLNSAELH